ncbi:DUF1571 domain-containing protein [Paenibacillus germinis]|nr:DUF1571 domain-containing protein [Paenibacillus germinis]
MKMKKLVTFAIIGLAAGISIASISYSVNGTTSNKLNFVNTKEKVISIPIIKEKVLNANNNYKFLEGTVIRTNNQNNRKSKTSLWIAQPNNFKVQFTPNIDKPDEFIESVNNGTEVQTKNKDKSIQKSKPMKEAPAPKVDSDDVVIPNYNGTFLPIGDVNELLHPELVTQTVFREGDITVTEGLSFLDRKVTKVSVTLVQSKLGTSAEYLIDNETGIFLKIVRYDQDKVLDTYEFIDIKFPEKLKDNAFALFNN